MGQPRAHEAQYEGGNKMSGNWSVNLETEDYMVNKSLIVEDSIKAILDTKPGLFVNLAIAENHGNPDEYLVPALEREFGERVAIKFVDQCGCGGYVYRVTRVS